MTLLYTDGFDNVATIIRPEYTNNPAVAFTGRTGVANHAMGLTALGGSRVLALPVAAATCVVGVGMSLSGIQANGYTGNGNPLQFQTAVGTTGLSLTFDAAFRPQIRLATTGTVLATGTDPAPTPNVWFHVQVKVRLHTSTGICEVKINGTTVINYSGQTAAAAASCTSIVFGNPSTGGSSAQVLFDDLYVCDIIDATATQGRPNNDFLGDLAVVTLLPTAAGASTGWTPSTGSNFAAVDDPAPNTTDYVSALASTTGTRDLYEVTDLVSVVTVYGLRVGTYSQKTDAGAANIKTVLRESGGGVTLSGAKALSTTFSPLYGDLVCLKSGGGLWSASDVSAMQAGMETA